MKSIKRGFSQIVILGAIMLATTLIVIGFFIYQKRSMGQLSKLKKPPIIDYYACGDYCPGPPKKYMVKIYQGIKDPEECKTLGGIPYTYYGWGETRICKVED